MTAIRLAAFQGENRAKHPLNLPETVGVSSVNQNPVRGDLRPWRAPLAVATVPAGRQTIYRFGRDVASDEQYWMSWANVVYVVRGFNSDDTTERTFYTGDGVPKWIDNTFAIASAPYPTTFRLLGLPPPEVALLTSATGGVSETTESRYYVQTYVNNRGDESAPGPVSTELVCKTDDTVTITNIDPPPSGAYGIDRIRIYRTQSGKSGETEFFFLRELISTATSTTDDNRALGEVLPSVTWLAPPDDLNNLTGMWNGMMAGITEGTVRVCEAYKPYAWPIAYEVIPPDSKPVALAKYGQALLVLTTGRPVLVTGTTPDGLDDQPLEIAEACVSPRSVVSFGHGVAWACPDGLAYFGAGGAKIITVGIMTKEDWSAIKPETIVGSMYEGAYLGFYTVDDVVRGFLIDPINPTGILFTDIPGDAVFFDELQDQLYILDGTDIKKWNAGESLTVTFKSKVFRTPKPLNFSCFEVVTDAYPVALKVWADGVLKHNQSVTRINSRRMRGDYMAQDWQVQISLAGALQGFQMAESIKELAS